MGKIKSLKRLQKIISKLKKQDKTIAFTNGCFDLIHPGHLKILAAAKKQGDVLIVGLNSDSSVKKIKGSKRPILNQNARSQILESIGIVDFIVLFQGKTPYSLIKKLRPDILVKGEDWGKDEVIGSNLVKKTYRVKMHPGYSTSRIITHIKKNA